MVMGLFAVTVWISVPVAEVRNTVFWLVVLTFKGVDRVEQPGLFETFTV